VHYYLGSKQTRLTTNVADTKKELALFKQKNDEIIELRQKLQDLEKKRFEPVHIMDELAGKMISERMWLTRLNIGSSQMDIDGIALDNKTVADFIDNLEGLPELGEQQSHMYERIRLNKLQQELIRNLNMKKFEISALKSVAPEQVPADKKNIRK
jgi:type IV pilus assembly protein PilN